MSIGLLFWIVMIGAGFATAFVLRGISLAVAIVTLALFFILGWHEFGFIIKN